MAMARIATLVIVGVSFCFHSISAFALISSSNGVMSEIKRILVTGANSGIGLALTKQLVADHGCHVYLGSRNAERGAEAVEEVKKSAGGSVELLTIDVSDDASVKSAAASLSQKLAGSKLHAIVNNAGVGMGVPFAEMVDINTRGPMRVTESFLPMLEPRGGRIVSTGSGAGPMFFDKFLKTNEHKEKYCHAMSNEEIEKELVNIKGLDNGFATYAGSKALVACYTMALARDHPELLVSVITPGAVKTKLTGGSGSLQPEEATVSLRKCLIEELSGSGFFWGSDGLRSPLHIMRNPGDPEYDGAAPLFD